MAGSFSDKTILALIFLKRQQPKVGVTRCADRQVKTKFCEYSNEIDF